MSTQFEIGTVYQARSACDYQCVFEYEVVGRSAKFITIAHGGDTKRVGIKSGPNGEWAMPSGSYSMAPVIYAIRPAV
jgi:hypothetical protein